MRAYVVSLSSPAGAIKRLDTAIDDQPHHIVVNDKLRRGYALVVGAIKVFNTDSDALISTSQKPSCSPEVIAINQATGMIYGGGLSNKGECLVQFDSDGRIVRENVVAPSVQGKNMLVQRIAVDSASGDVLYTNPSSVGRADQMLNEKWRTPVDGPAEVQDLGFEPHSNTVYVTVGNFPVISPARVSVLDGGTGSQRGEFSGPGWTSQFAATGDGRLFVAFFNSNDLYALSDGTSTLTKFASLGDIPGRSPSDPKWLEVDTAGRRLFVSPGGDGHKILVYQY
ncbi:MAG: YncE family protein [Mycobacterium sp.]